MTDVTGEKHTWRFPTAFWAANAVELFERAAYYGMFIALTLYLTDIVGFSDVTAAWIGGIFAAGLYLLPPFAGAVADMIGFRRALLLAFTLLTAGYAMLGALPAKLTVLAAIMLVMVGGSFIKSVITGTVAKTSDATNRARAFSIFYGIVNIGSFTGKTIAYPVRINLGLEAINFYSAGMTFVALIIVFLLYKNVAVGDERRTLADAWRGLVRVLGNLRLVALILIVAGFWIVQSQLYATMPKYVLRTVGKMAAPEWIANVNPLVVVISVVGITQMMKRVKAISSITVGMLLMPLSALCMASSSWLESVAGPSITIFAGLTAHPITVMLIVGIILQGLAECFISPRYLEFFSLQAPKGEEGLYLGFGHLHSFFAMLLGFGISGYLLSIYCPDPNTLTPAQLVGAYDHAYYIWFYFAGIGLASVCALYVYAKFTSARE